MAGHPFPLDEAAAMAVKDAVNALNQALDACFERDLRVEIYELPPFRQRNRHATHRSFTASVYKAF